MVDVFTTDLGRAAYLYRIKAKNLSYLHPLFPTDDLCDDLSLF